MRLETPTIREMVFRTPQAHRSIANRRARLGLSAITALCSLSPTAAVAQSPSQSSPVRISVDSLSECIQAGPFSVALAHVAPVRPAIDGEQAPIVRLQVRRSDDRLVGTLVLETDGVPSVERSVTGADCDEVTDALRLMAALALGYETPAPARPLPPPPAETRPPALVTLPPLSPSVPQPRSYHAWIEALGGWAWLGDGPRGWTAEVAAEFSTIDRYEPTFRLSASAMRKQAIYSPGRAELTWLTARPHACYPVLRFGAVGAQPCIGIDAGLVQAAGQGVESSRTAYRAWLGPMASARLYWKLTDRWRLSLQGTFIAPWGADEFAFEPGAVVYRPPAVLFLMQGGLAWRFP